MKKYLITGFSGFVSKHFLDLLEKTQSNTNVLGIDLNTPEYIINKFINVKYQYKKIDMLNKDELEKVVCQFKPDYILHLASYSSVAYSWINPIKSFNNNTNIFLNLLEVIRLNNIKCRILSVGSSEEYGNVLDQNIPIKENISVEPLNPYAAARVSQEMLSNVYVKGYNLDIIMTRSFNHIGPGQKEIFVVPSFAKQLVNLYKNKIKRGKLVTGDIAIIRDFVDVRDVVYAYYLLFNKGKRGEVYNVCSGRGNKLSDIITMMVNILELRIKIRQDSSLIRPIDNKIIIGNNNKIKKHTDWKIKYTIYKSVEDTINYWMETT